MQRKFEVFSGLVVIFVAFAGLMELFLNGYQSNYDKYLTERQLSYDNYSANLEQTSLFFENKMAYRCLKEGEFSSPIKMSKDGLNGACGFGGVRYNTEKNCTEVYTYGEELNGTEIAQKIISLKNDVPTPRLMTIEQYEPNYAAVNFLKNSSLIIAFVLSILAMRGFKKIF